MIQSVESLDVAEKRVFVRCDLNVPLDDQGTILDDSRIQASLSTIRFLLKNRARVILASHLGRPEGKPDPKCSLMPVGIRLAELLYPHASEVKLSDAPTGDSARKLIRDMLPGEVVLLENLRFDPGEEANEETFAKELAKQIDVYVNDAFASSHRAHASTVGMVRYVPEKAAGILMLREIEMLGRLLGSIERPYVAILGGKKIEDKLGVLKRLLDRVQTILVGGAMSHPFLRAQGIHVGKSVVTPEQIKTAEVILSRAQTSKVHLLLPVDALVSSSLKNAPVDSVPIHSVPSDNLVLDIGPKTVDLFRRAILSAKTVFWNGPMGAYEYPPFDQGTKTLAKAFASYKGFSVVGGGDSLAAISSAGVSSFISHLSTGGGASLEFVEGKVLPGIAALDFILPPSREAAL